MTYDPHMLNQVIENCTNAVRKDDLATLAHSIDWVQKAMDGDITALGKPFLLTASMSNRKAMVKMFLDQGMPVNVMTRKGEIIAGRSDGQTAIHQAETPEILRLLHERGAHINCKTVHRETALHGIAKKINQKEHQTSMIQTMIDLGADVNARNMQGKTPLLVMVEKIASLVNNDFSENIIEKCTPGMEALLEAGADVNARDLNGCNALGKLFLQSTFGSRQAHHAIIPTLLKYGAHIDPESGQYEAIISSAIQYNSLELFKRVLDLGAKGGWRRSAIGMENALMMEAVEVGALPFVNEMLAHGWDVDPETFKEMEKFYPEAASMVRSSMARGVAAEAIRELSGAPAFGAKP